MDKLIKTTKESLDNSIYECQERKSLNKHYDKMIESTKAELMHLEKKFQKMKEVLKKENYDVEKLSKLSLSNFVKSITGKKADILEKEKQEALAAKLQYDSVHSQLQSTRKLVKEMVLKRESMPEVKDEYIRLIGEKKAYVMQYMPNKWQEINGYMEEEQDISFQLTEIGEALAAGNLAKYFIDKAERSLASASNWGMADMLGGGFFTTAIKRGKMNDAQSYIAEMQEHITKFTRELKDIDALFIPNIDLGGYLRISDYLFDGFWVDIAIQSKIRKATQHVDKARSEIRTIVNKLKIEFDELKKRRAESRLD